MFRWLANFVRGPRDATFLALHGHLGHWLFAGTSRLVAAGVPIIADADPIGRALSAPVITRTSGVTTYPPTIDIARQPDWQDGNLALAQRSQDATFATGVSEGIQTLASGTTTYDFGLSNILSGIWYVREATYTGGSRPPSLNWSNIVGVGDTTTPTISSSNSASGYQFVAGTKALTASKSGYWAIVGGSYQAQFAISGNNLAWDAQSGTPAMDVQVQFTDYFGNPSTAQTITVTIGANTPDAFTFTDVTNSSLSTQYTSNTINIAGLQGGASVPVTITGGTYSKNGGAYTSAAGTAINGDTITLRCTSPSANNGTTTVILAAGATSDTWTVASPVVLGSTSTWNPADKGAGITLTNGNMTAGAAPYAFYTVRGTVSQTTGLRQIEAKLDQVDGAGNCGLGFADSSQALNNYLGNGNHGTAYFHDSTVTYNSIADGSPQTTYTAGDYIQATIDLATNEVKYYKNGALQKTVTIPGFSGAIFPAFTDQGGNLMTLNTGHSTFNNAIAGAIPWDQ